MVSITRHSSVDRPMVWLQSKEAQDAIWQELICIGFKQLREPGITTRSITRKHTRFDVSWRGGFVQVQAWQPASDSVFSWIMNCWRHGDNHFQGWRCCVDSSRRATIRSTKIHRSQAFRLCAVSVRLRSPLAFLTHWVLHILDECLVF